MKNDTLRTFITGKPNGKKMLWTLYYVSVTVSKGREKNLWIMNKLCVEEQRELEMSDLKELEVK